MDIKDQIKRSVPIIEVARLYIDLKPAGKYYKGLCPFHTEKTPSFFVMPDKDSYACYGCNKFGDIFSLVQEMENISFPDALNFLIDKFNIPIEKRKNSSKIKKDIYVGINEIALKYFIDNLSDTPEGKKARSYLKERGIEHNTIELFSLGYAENKWDGLFNHLKKNAVNIANAVELGLLIDGNNNRIYDRFRGRIIFPIRSESGALIAFGGRTIFDEPSKYLNSPDNPVYKKSNHLFGFDHSKQSIRKEKAVILVEGYFDMISLYQHGITNVAASLGTALTENQIYLLRRFADDIYIYYDSDKAGVAAAVRGIEKMFEQDINPKIIMLRDAKDPDDFIREKGLKAFNNELARAANGFRFLLNRIDADFPDWDRLPERKKTAVEKIKNSLDKINDHIIMDGYKELAADYFRINIDELKLKDKRNTIQNNVSKVLTITLAEKIFLESILQMPVFIKSIKDLFTDKLLSVLASGNIIRLIFQNFDQGKNQIDCHRAAAAMTIPEKSAFRRIFETVKDSENNKEELWKRVESGFLELQAILNKQDTQKINQDIKIAERENNFEEVKRLTAKKYKFIKAMYDNKQEE
jgi:DNA primase